MITLDLTKQQAFDQMVRGLASQGWEQSRQAVGGGCQYRGIGGRKCAVGWLIPDELYDPKLDDSADGDHDTNIGALVDERLLDVDASLLPFLREAQHAHDWRMVRGQLAPMREAFLDLGVRHNLTWPEGV